MAEAKTVAILGGGPVGLAAAAHVLERGMEPVVLEAGPDAATPCASGPMCGCSRPGNTTSTRQPDGCWRRGLDAPSGCDYPTGGELVAQYLEPLATRTPLKDRIRTRSRVTSVGRVGFDKVKTRGREAAPFEVRYENGKGPESLRADAVIDATGTWLAPNPAGADGRPAMGEREVQDRLADGMPDVLGRDRARYAGRSVAVLGAGHSASAP